MCALGASSQNGNNGYRERLALLLKDNEKQKQKQTRRRWKGYVTLTEAEDHSVSHISSLQSHRIEGNEPWSMQQGSSPYPTSPSVFGRR